MTFIARIATSHAEIDDAPLTSGHNTPLGCKVTKNIPFTPYNTSEF